MSLHYRGIAYDPAASDLKVTDSSATVGHYRGASWKIHSARAVQAKRSGVHLKYRGAWVNAD